MRCPGLEFRVTPAGSRSFSFRFRDPNGGAVTRSTIGRYPEISLSDARTAADTLRGKVAKGINPVTEKRRDREDAGNKTFRRLSDRYIEEHAKRFSDPLVPTNEICACISCQSGASVDMTRLADLT